MAVIDDKDMSEMTEAKKKKVANWFVKYGSMWHVDPVLLACIAAKESGFRPSPPPLVYCQTKIVDGSARKVCKPKRLEEGMMQSIPYLRVTKRGYWYCFGKVLSDREDLRDREASICVGAYELSSRSMWVKSRIKRRGRIRARNRRHSRFLSRMTRKYGKGIIPVFWATATYNWGPRILKRNRGRYDSLGYPIRVIRCYAKYAYGPKKEKFKDAKVKVASEEVRGTGGSGCQD